MIKICRMFVPSCRIWYLTYGVHWQCMRRRHAWSATWSLRAELWRTTTPACSLLWPTSWRAIAQRALSCGATLLCLPSCSSVSRAYSFVDPAGQFAIPSGRKPLILSRLQPALDQSMKSSPCESTRASVVTDETARQAVPMCIIQATALSALLTSAGSPAMMHGEHLHPGRQGGNSKDVDDAAQVAVPHWGPGLRELKCSIMLVLQAGDSRGGHSRSLHLQ